MPAFVYQSGLTVEQIADAAQGIVFKAAELQQAMREDGVIDLKPISLKTAGFFAKALVLERQFGQTTDECLYWLNRAVEALPA